MPHSDEAEKGIIGSMLLDAKCSARIIQEITPDHFHVPANHAIYNAALELYTSGDKVDLITLTNHLRSKSILDAVGGPSYVTELFTFVPSSSNVDYYLEIAKDKFILRSVIKECCTLIAKCEADAEPPASILAESQTILLALGMDNQSDHSTVREFAFQAMEQIEEAMSHGGKIPGLTTGLIDLDRQLGGMKPQQMIVIAADTAQGKTALALNIAEHLSIIEKIPVGIISLEMSGVELTERIIASHGKINLHKIFTSGAKNVDTGRITRAVETVANAPLTIRDDPDVDFAQMRAIGRQMKQEHKIELIIVDYVQLLTPQSTKDENRERAMSAAAQACKQMAKELNCVVIVLSQVNEQKKLRESKAIGHHADKVILITHDENEPGLCYANVVKNRQGPSGVVNLTFLKDFARFESTKLIVEKSYSTPYPNEF